MYVKNLVYNEVTGTPYASTATEITVSDASVFGDPASVGNYDVTLYNLRKNPGKAFNDGEAAVLLLTGIDTGTNTLTFNTQIGITLSDSIDWAVIQGATKRVFDGKANLTGGNTFSGVQNFEDDIVIGSDKSFSPIISNSNPDGANALTIQPNTGNVIGSGELYPSGTEDRTHWTVANDSDKANYGAIKWEINGAKGSMWAYTKGTGGTLPTHFIFGNFANGVWFEDGISFDSGMNVFSSHEEPQTFTPAYSFATSGSVTHSTQSGEYMILNGYCFFSLRLVTSAISSPMGDASITGLPKVCSSQNSAPQGVYIGRALRFATDMSLRAVINDATDEISLYNEPTNGSVQRVLGSDINSGSNQNILNISGFYPIV